MTKPACTLVFIILAIMIVQPVFSQNDLNEGELLAVIPDKRNPVDQEYPGGRGWDEMVLYTPAYGERTGTNKYGIEAIVENGYITQVGQNNSIIPKNGFVVSGHGEKLRWISQFLRPGIAAEIKNDSLVFRVDIESRIRFAEYFLGKAVKNVNDSPTVHPSISIDYINSLAQQSKTAIAAARDTVSNRAASEANAETAVAFARDAFYASFPSRDKEVRACWYRLTEKTPAELEATVRRMVEMGFNTICPEVIYDGYAIYPDAHKGLPQHPDFIGWDPLKELIWLCQSYNLKLVAWVWVYHVGQAERSYLVQAKPEWLAVSRQNEHPSQVEKGYHFLCPSREPVRKFWLDVYKKLLKNYDIDGLQLDYIRYPVSEPWNLGYCYCTHCTDTFLKNNQINPMAIDPEQDANFWEIWSRFRINQVNTFVRQVRRLVDKEAPEVALSADVFPDTEESVSTKYQDWVDWLRQGYLDEIYTMSYTPDAETVNKEATFLVSTLPTGVSGYVGLGPYQGFRPEILLEEIKYVQDAGANGISLFSFGSLTPAQIDALKKGPFRNPAVVE